MHSKTRLPGTQVTCLMKPTTRSQILWQWSRRPSRLVDLFSIRNKVGESAKILLTTPENNTYYISTQLCLWHWDLASQKSLQQICFSIPELIVSTSYCAGLAGFLPTLIIASAGWYLAYSHVVMTLSFSLSSDMRCGTLWGHTIMSQFSSFFPV